MRCRIHVEDNSSSVGVCASCLRHRLSAVSAHGHPPTVTQYLSHDTPESPPPPPLPKFPRSVSPPYANRRHNPTDEVIASDQRFFSTPQPDDVVGGNKRFFSTPQARRTLKNDNVGIEKDDKSKKRLKKFSLFDKLFRSRSDKVRKKKSNLNSEDVLLSPKDSNTTSSSSSPFKFLMKRNKKNQQQDTHSYSMFFSEEESSSTLPVSGKGVPKPRRAFSDNDYYRNHDHDHGDMSPTESDYSSESSGWRKTPVGGKGGKVSSSSGGSRVGSGLGLCLSPLVRAGPSPSKFWGQKSGGMLTPEKAMYSSGEFRKAKSPMYLTNAASFCKSRSRKMADFGRPIRSHH